VNKGARDVGYVARIRRF